MNTSPPDTRLRKGDWATSDKRGISVLHLIAVIPEPSNTPERQWWDRSDMRMWSSACGDASSATTHSVSSANLDPRHPRCSKCVALEVAESQA